MPIPVIVLAVLGTLYVLWPAPKIDQAQLKPQTMVGQQHIDWSKPKASATFTAGVTVPRSNDPSKNAPEYR